METERIDIDINFKTSAETPMSEVRPYWKRGVKGQRRARREEEMAVLSEEAGSASATKSN